MIIVMEASATRREIEAVCAKLVQEGFSVHLSEGVARTIIGVIGDRTRAMGLALEAMPGVEKAIPVLNPFKLVSREFRQENTIVSINGRVLGGNEVHLIAGPCSVESREQLLETAWAVKEAGATLLRGGAFKPRTSPYSFQGLEEAGLEILAEARERTGLPVVTEVVDPRFVSLVGSYADVLQIGARNMQNYFLLKEVAKVKKPVLLKRGPSATVEEWLMAAEYIMLGGNDQIILCERGIRTFETFTRNTLDLSAVPVVKRLSHLPVIVDPSHGTGKWWLVQPMAQAAIAAGADGLMVEVHPDPGEALSDGKQSLTPENFRNLVASVKEIAVAVGRRLSNTVAGEQLPK
ncbi:phospho-2-dehydro-3-deoxyheptonate aldolase AroF [Thermacetogenium phaeum DSM 12270]|jgi:3-deoxy-7-phosphoheptulonate synthase|uniref:Phospho-2-dehydro-3-deoxyheptonate aldolase AroF n=1 Tax=Thermacetogenium phaeum (strain ATCC BAA-254 / DSM 26808 / PB) TaxID=1089553 RepID=K4LGT4_THEPS|nr:3-deoxy-7-phosphoheptulonate synthase [Thermacetogenium phaeum]AFV11180.1 phospho-2-dehydro-3-deoxyheptonate aldolase AroF [Thermacetogenium phaeum DSM 12270]